MDTTTQAILIILFTILWAWALMATIEVFSKKHQLKWEEAHCEQLSGLLQTKYDNDCGCDCCKLDAAEEEEETTEQEGV